MPVLYTRIIAGVAAVIAVFGFGYWRGHHAVQVQFDAYKHEVEAAAAAQQKHVEEVTAKQEKITQGVRDDYKKRLADIAAFYSRVRPNDSGSVPKLSLPASGTNGTAADNLPYLCAITTAQLVSLQDWIKQQELIND